MSEKKDIPTTEEVKSAAPRTQYAAIMASMTPDQLAAMGVRLISINGNELWWVTSTGQLYAFGAQQQAIAAEYRWLLSELEQAK